MLRIVTILFHPSDFVLPYLGLRLFRGLFLWDVETVIRGRLNCTGVCIPYPLYASGISALAFRQERFAQPFHSLSVLVPDYEAFGQRLREEFWVHRSLDNLPSSPGAPSPKMGEGEARFKVPLPLWERDLG